METPFYIEPVIDDRTIIDGCSGKNGHYQPRTEDNEWDEIILKKIREASIEIEKATRKK